MTLSKHSFAIACAVIATGFAQSPNAQQKVYVRGGSLRPDLQVALEHLGNRLSVPGKEALQLSGRVSHEGGAKAPFEAILEPPDKVRFREGPTGGLVSGFDGTVHWNAGGTVSHADEGMLETVLLDSFERLFYRQQSGDVTRKIGGRFRIADGARPTFYAGPIYDIYAVFVDLPGNGKKRQSWKWYYVNSNTLLLDRVEYRDATGTMVATTVEWAQANGEWVPSSISRFESGREVLKIDVAFAVIMAAQSPSIYSNAAGRP